MANPAGTAPGAASTTTLDRRDGSRPVVTSDRRVAGSTPDLSRETDALRRDRLRAACIFMLAAVGVFLARALLIVGDPLWPLKVVAALAIGGALALLSGRGPVPPRLLRGVELGIF